MTTSAPYYGDSAVMRTPPPDLPSLLLKERIVYLGLPLFSDDDAKRQMGIDVTELIIAQLLFLEFDNPEKPIYFYINSTGTSWYWSWLWYWWCCWWSSWYYYLCWCDDFNGWWSWYIGYWAIC